jgi:predicted hotdog family 3-hydroxylacyl-ACP dehydratase
MTSPSPLSSIEDIPLPLIEDILLHRGNMLLIDRVIAFSKKSTTTEYSPRCGTWYSDTEGKMPAWIGIELMAQAIAAHVGMVKHSEGLAQKHGVLVGTRSYRSTLPSFAADVPLQTQVTVAYQDISGLSAYDCSIACGDTTLATATIKVFEPEDFQNFVQGSSS